MIFLLCSNIQFVNAYCYFHIIKNLFYFASMNRLFYFGTLRVKMGDSRFLKFSLGSYMQVFTVAEKQISLKKSMFLNFGHFSASHSYI